MASVELRGVNMVYPSGDHALRDFDLVVADRELVVIVGPSGSGKSTILRLVAGLETPTTGDVTIGGEPMDDVSPRRRDVALAFQSYALYPHMTVFDNLAFPLRMDRVHRRDVQRRVEHVAQVLQIVDVLERHPGTLSGGQRQRVSLGRAIIRDPRVLLMDEPLSNLDAKLRMQMRYVIATLQHRLGVTTLYVTHDQEEALAIADRVVMIDDGRVRQVSPPAELYAEPVDVVVARFIGWPPMNLLRARVHGSRLVLGGHAFELPASVGARFVRPGRDGGIPDGEVIAGLRAEAIVRSPTGPFEVSALDSEVVDQRRLVTVDLPVEGAEVTPDGVDRTGRSRTTVVLAADPDDDISLWRPHRLDLDLERLHLFDPATGRSLSRRWSDRTAATPDGTGAAEGASGAQR